MDVINAMANVWSEPKGWGTADELVWFIGSALAVTIVVGIATRR